MPEWGRLWAFYKPPYKLSRVEPGWVDAVYAAGMRLKAQAETNMQTLNEFAVVDGLHYWKGVELEALQKKGDLFDTLEFTNNEKLNTVSQAVSQCINIIMEAGIQVNEGSIARQLLDVLEPSVQEGNG